MPEVGGSLRAPPPNEKANGPPFAFFHSNIGRNAAAEKRVDPTCSWYGRSRRSLRNAIAPRNQSSALAG